MNMNMKMNTNSNMNAHQQNKTWGKRMRILFHAMLILAFVQLSCLLYVGFWHTTNLESTSPLEELLITSIMGLERLQNGDDVEENDEEELVNNGNAADVVAADDDDDLALPVMANPMEQGTPLDNYYSRRQRTSLPTDAAAVPLIVGGSDGSGTRAFVDILTRLGVPMLVDDPGTMDVHAGKLFDGKGWPPFAKIALNFSKHTSNYDIADVPLEFRDQVEKQLVRLRDQFEIRYTKLKNKLANSPRGRTNRTLPSAVTFGFKAPITMLLLPMIQAFMYPTTGFKYLHIVRDGRDVALSSNQSPVAKFYAATYPDAAQRIQQYGKSMAPVFAMHLWNDWNADLYDWERNQQQQPKAFFEFLVMRSEDLLHPESKLEALTMLADFVGSPKTPQELCCMCKKAVVDMGQSGVGGGRNKHMNAATDTLLEYMDRKKKLQHKLAELSGKSNPEDMTAREMLEAKMKYKDALKEFRDEKQPERRTEERFSDIGNRVAQRIANRHDTSSTTASSSSSSIHHNAVQHRQTTDPRISEFLRTLPRRNTLDPAVSDLVGRRRRLSLSSSDGAGLSDAAAASKGQVRVVRLPEGFAGRMKLIRQRRMRKKQDMGDERLIKLIASQLEVLKGNALKQTNNITVTDRYGKWATMLRSAPELSQAMHREGARALELFGYHPPRRFMDRRPASEGSFVCDETVVCPDSKQ